MPARVAAGSRLRWVPRCSRPRPTLFHWNRWIAAVISTFEEPDVFATEIWTAFRQFRATPLADRGGDRRLT